MEMQTFYKSLKNHQIKCAGTSWFSLPVILEASDNTYISYPCAGVIRFAEQSTNLNIAVAIFHAIDEQGNLGAPVSAKNPKFRYDPR